MPSLDREGWPPGAVHRIECANCGRQEYALTTAPHQQSGNFDAWLRPLPGDWRSMHTRLGFMVWCSVPCEGRWRQANHRRIKPAFSYTDVELKHKRYLDEKSRASGAYGA